MQKRYIDFDGVVVDTEKLLFEKWRKNPNRDKLSEKDKIEYIKKQDWHRICFESEIINDSIYLLRNMDPKETFILTKVQSLEEAINKINYLRVMKIKQGIIIVPSILKKCEVVNASNAILVDDSIKNLKEWQDAGGYPMFFDRFWTNIDGWGQKHEQGFQRVRKINEVKK